MASIYRFYSERRIKNVQKSKKYNKGKLKDTNYGYQNERLYEIN